MTHHDILKALAAAALLSGCTTFTGSEDVTLDGEPITEGNGPGIAVPLPNNPEIQCAYPIADAFGPSMGQTLSPSISWMGYPASEAAPRAFPITELYDCAGQDIHAILVTTSQYNCSACSQEAGMLEGMIANWQSQGLNIAVVTLLVDGPGDSAPSEAGAAQWKQEYGLSNVSVFADPNYSMIQPGMSFGTPYETVIDPKTMQVTFIQEGFSGSFPEAEQLARTNAGVGQL